MTPFVVHPDVLLEGGADSALSEIVGRPAVAWDPEARRYVMLLETQLAERFYDPTEFPDCPWGVWGLVRATSEDGIHWELDPEPVVVPDAGTDHSCVLAHPSVIFDGQSWHLWVKAEKGNSDGSTYSGIAYATSFDGIHWSFREELILSVEDFGESDLLALGYPTVVMLHDTWWMQVAKQYKNGEVSLLSARSADLGRSWQLDQDPVFEPGGADWVQDHIYNPAPVCEDDPAKLPLTMFFAGRTSDWSDVGFGKASSADGVRWTVTSEAPYFSWQAADGESPWIHWTVMRAGDDYVVYYTEKETQTDGSVKDVLRVAYTSPDWDEDSVSPGICPPPTHPTDGDGGGDTDEDDEDTDGDDIDVDVGCSCRTGAAGTPIGQLAAWGAALGIVLMLRGRQRA
jgi:hypothetical protein